MTAAFEDLPTRPITARGASILSVPIRAFPLAEGCSACSTFWKIQQHLSLNGKPHHDQSAIKF